MAIRAGAILHDAQGFIVDRIQTGGPSNLNIPQEKIFELGNWSSVATVFDTPELSFDMESFDMTTEIESLLAHVDSAPGDYDADAASTVYDFQNNIPIDILSPWKSARNAFTIAGGIIIPFLALESATYRFGVGQNSTQSFTLSGDGYYMAPDGSVPRWERVALTAGVSQAYGMTDTADVFTNGATTEHIVSAKVVSTATGIYKRLVGGGTNYTTTTTTVTLDATNDWNTLGYTHIDLCYFTGSPSNFAGVPGNPDYDATADSGIIGDVHEGVAVKPAAIRGKDVDFYYSTVGTTGTWTRVGGVQSTELTWNGDIEQDNELGNDQAVDQGFDIPTVNGSVTLRPFDYTALYNFQSVAANVTPGEAIGPATQQPLHLQWRINHPDTGAVLKTLETSDGRITLPPMQGQVQQKLDITASFESDSGDLRVYKGVSPNN